LRIGREKKRRGREEETTGVPTRAPCKEFGAFVRKGGGKRKKEKRGEEQNGRDHGSKNALLT